MPQEVSPGEVLGWLRARRSVRQYRAHPVLRERVTELLEAARCSPTGHNAREVGCVVLASQQARELLARDVCTVYRRLGRALENPILRWVLVLWTGTARVRELREALPGLRWAEEQFRAGHDPLFHHAPVVLVLHAPPAETAEADCALAAG
ncbi:MAG: nitroreductase family protein, partial [Deferrisomatales bacterium]|nr:nitroreductase family protein [Deferrisomatales bacterium]